MDLQILTSFFMWCTIINAGLLCVGALAIVAGREVIQRVHARWFGVSPETCCVATYCFLAIYKIFLIVFGFVPWMALLILGRG